MLHDLRFALRQLAHHRWFSLAIIVTLALGIGINTTVFTLVNAVLFKPVPVPGGERLTVVTQDIPNHRGDFGPVSLPEYRAYRDGNRSFSALEAASSSSGVISEAGNPPERFPLGTVSPGLFAMIQTPPILGRPFATADGEAGAPNVVMLGHRVWQTRYGGARDVVGRTVRLNGEPATIIGVMPAGFKFPNNQELWTALKPTPAREVRTARSLILFGLRRPDVSLAEAQSDLALIAAATAQEFPDTNKDVAARVQTFHDLFNGGPIRLIFLLMLGAVGFVLLIACANVANMMLSRAIVRSREMAVRAALGASRPRLVRQLLVESVLLSVLGGAAGLALSLAGVHAFDLATQDVGKPYWIQFTMDWRAFGYFAVVSIASGLVFGLVPALRASRVDLNTALKDGTAAGSVRGGRLTAALVVFQFAATVVLLAGAGLMIRSFVAVQQINPFVPAQEILGVRLALPARAGDRYETPEARRAMHEKLQQRLAALPGVSHAALVSEFPGLGSQSRAIEIEGRPPVPEGQPALQASVIFGSPEMLPAIQLPLLMGRQFEANDGLAGRETAIVTQDFARRFWGDASPIGKRFRLPAENPAPASAATPAAPPAWVTVVGVSGNLVHNTQDRNAPPLVFLPQRAEPAAWTGILLRTAGDPARLTPAVRAAIQELDPDLPLFEVRTLTEAIERQHWFLRVFGSLFFSFAAIALLMASVGIYAVVAQNTARRTREIGIRMALGASAGRVVRLVLRRGLVQLGLGLVLGLAGALAATRLLDTVLGLVSPQDPLVFGSIAVLLSAIGLFACWLPARRAARVPPTVALRIE